VAENDLIFTRGWADRVLQDVNASDADRATATWVVNQPFWSGIAQGATEFMNPANDAVGGVLGTAGKILVRESPEVAGIVKGVQAAHAATTGAAMGAAGRTAARLTAPARARLMQAAGRAAVRVARATPLGARLFDRAAQKGPVQTAGGEAAPSVTDRLGAAGVHAAVRQEGTAHQLIRENQQKIMPLWDGLDVAQKQEMLRVSGRDAAGNPLHARNPEIKDPDPIPPTALDRVRARLTGKPAVPRPSMTIQERANAYRDWKIEQDRIAQSLGIRLEDEINPATGEVERGTGNVYDPNTHFNMKLYDQNPRFTGDIEKINQRLKGLAPNEATGQGIGKARIGVGDEEHSRANPIVNDEAWNDLHEDFDPAYQANQHIIESQTRIANAREAQRLNMMPSIDPATGRQRTQRLGDQAVPLNVRQEAPYEWQELDPATGKMVTKTGQGREARDLLDALEKKRIKAGAWEKTLADPAAQAHAAAVGRPLADFNTRSITAQRTGPYLARARQAIAAQRQVLSGLRRASNRAGGLAPIAQNLERSGARMDDALRANMKAAGAAARRAPEYEKAAQDAQEYHAQLQKAIDHAPTPTKRQITEVARAMFEQDMDEYGRAADAYHGVADELQRLPGNRGGIRPDWIRTRGPNGKSTWKLAGEWQELSEQRPKSRFIDWTKPKDDDPTGRIDSNIDAIATERNFLVPFSSGDELREWLERHPTPPKPPKYSQYLDRAQREITDMFQQADRAGKQRILEQIGMPDKGPAEALYQLRRQVAELKAGAARASKEAENRRFAERELGPGARASVAAQARAAAGLWQTAVGLDGDIARLNRDMQKAVTSTRDRLAQRRALTEAKLAISARFKKFQKDLMDATTTPLRERSIKVPEGYSLEAEQGYGHTYEWTDPDPNTGKRKVRPMDYVRDSSLINYSKTLTPQAQQDLHWVLKAMGLASTLQRMGIVALPFVHAFNNLGMHGLQEGVAPQRLYDVYRGAYKPDPAMIEEMTDWGYRQGAAEEAFRMGKTDVHGTTAGPQRRAIMANRLGNTVARKTGERDLGDAAESIARPAMAVADKFSGGYNRMNHWLFGQVQDGIAASIYERLRKPVAQGGEGLSPGEAVQRVLKAVSDPANITPFERRAGLDKLFYFLPWMKTVVPFQIKKGLIDPKWWTSQVSGIRTNNELQGYDDPSQPFTMTLSRPDDQGRVRRAPLFTPQRVLGAASDAVRIPADLYEGATSDGRGYERALTDAMAPFNYVAGHLVAPAELGWEGVQAGLAARSPEGAASLPPYNPFSAPPGSKFPTGAYIANALAAGLLSPVEKAESIGQTMQGASPMDYLTQLPADAAMSLIGSTPYLITEQKTALEKRLDDRLKNPLERRNEAMLRRELLEAQQAGDEGAYEDILKQLDAAP
jgi:hypothetical protein